MSTSINTVTYVRSPLNSSDLDGFEVLPTTPAFKPLTDEQYETWAQAVGIPYVGTVSAFHRLTGLAPMFDGPSPVGDLHRAGVLILASLEEALLAAVQWTDRIAELSGSCPTDPVAQTLAEVNKAATWAFVDSICASFKAHTGFDTPAQR